MLLSKILSELKYIKVIGKTDIEITDITLNSNQVNNGSLYICIKGQDYDGHSFSNVAEKYGAVAILTEIKLDVAITQIIVKNTRIAMSELSSIFYNHPDRNMKIIGVVGTNGKTTTTHIIKAILDEENVNCGIIGTLGAFYNNKFIEASLTTPDPIDLFKILRQMCDEGVKVVVMEVSAHAIALHKIDNIKFEIGIFTNFTQDHLDFFKNMGNYRKVKYSFFENNFCKYIVSNSDDKLGLEIINNIRGVVSYGIENPADVFAMEITEKDFHNKFILNLFDCVYKVDLNLIGIFNIYNALASSACAVLLGISCQNIVKGMEKIKYISGRLEKIYSDNYSIYIDYAHTPDGLKKSIDALANECKNRLICVFGCGGNRDKLKRPLMGEISGKYSDFTVITSDNPRFEDPIDIIKDIEKGIVRVTRKYVTIENREGAIKYAIEMAKDGDIILIAGKGSEQYQDIWGIKHPYNDKNIVDNILKRENN